jgi:hypothetical protein
MANLITRRSLLSALGILGAALATPYLVTTATQAQPMPPSPPLSAPPPAPDVARTGLERRVDRRTNRTVKRQNRRIRRVERRAIRRDGRAERGALRREGRAIRRDIRQGN